MSIPEAIVGKVTGLKEGIFRVSVQGTGKIQLKPENSLDYDSVIFQASFMSKTQV